MSNHHGIHQKAGGFTLVELLVVIVILSILASLALSGLVAARARGRAAKTRSTIRKLNEVVLPYYETFDTRRPQIPAGIESSGNRTLISTAQQIGLHRLMAMEMPDNSLDVIEAFTPIPIPGAGSANSLSEKSPVARRYRHLISEALNDESLADPTSADFLYLIVMRGAAADPDVIAHFRPEEIADTNGNGLLEFIDGWNNPIRFRRWPFGFVSPIQPMGTSVLVPLIYSSGQDGDPGFSENATSYRSLAYSPNAAPAITTTNAAADNIHNHDMIR